MSYVKRKFLVSRRYGASVWGSSRDAVVERNYPPGQHGVLGYSRLSRYAKQLKAIRQVTTHYGMMSKQFRNTFRKAKQARGDTGEILVVMLESRLDAFVYRAKLAVTIFAAKQLVSHGHVLVNGSKVDIGSYKLKPGDVVTVADDAKKIPAVLSAPKSPDRTVPDYIEADHDAFSAKFVRVPVVGEVPYAFPLDLNAIIAYYSK